MSSSYGHYEKAERLLEAAETAHGEQEDRLVHRAQAHAMLAIAKVLHDATE